MTLNDVFKIVSDDVGLSKAEVEKIYKAYWKAIREHITSIPLKEDLTEEEFEDYRPNVNIPSIGKLYVTFDKYKKRRDIVKGVLGE